MKPIPYGRQLITEEDKEAVLNTLAGDFLTQGPHVESFEKTCAQFVGAPHALAVTNGTAALHLAAMALEVRPGTKVLVTPNTFVASANCIRYCGGDVEFVDIDHDTLCMDLNLLEEKLASRPAGTYSGVVTVDFAGYPVDTEKLRKIADKYGLWIIEDACHAIGAKFRNSDGKWVHSGDGQYADISVFSFHPVKHIATGEGGLITTANAALYEKMKHLRTHGIVRDPALFEKNDGGWYYEMQYLGYNYRMSDILCALGASQMKRIESNLQRRQKIAKRYTQELSGENFELPKTGSDVYHAYHLYVIRTKHRNELYEYLKKNSIYPQVHYIPVHTQPYYKKLYGEVSLPVVESYYSEALSIPMFHGMTDDEQDYVIEKIKSFKKSF